MDCRRNSISALGQAHYTPQELHRVSALETLRRLRDEKGVEWDEQPPWFRFGTYVKKERYEKRAYNPVTSEQVMAERTRYTRCSFALEPDDAAFLLDRVWASDFLRALRSSGEVGKVVPYNGTGAVARERVHTLHQCECRVWH